MPNQSPGLMNQKLALETQTQKIGHIVYNKLTPTLTRDFKKRKKRNIVKLKDTAKTLTFLLSV